MTPKSAPLLQGTLDLIVLQLLRAEPTNGYDLTQRIQAISRDVLNVNAGSLYPALYRLEAQGWIKAEWGLSDNNRKARFYRLTAKGRKQLAAELEHWARIAAGINRVLAHA
jgi:transcriptional regulator